MGRREDLDEELDEDLDEAEELEDDDDEEPAPPRKAKASKAKAVPKPAKASQKGVPKPSPEETRALDVRIFDAADRLEAKLGRAPTHGEIAAAAKVPGASDGARKQRVSVAMRRRGLLSAAAPAKVKPEATKTTKPARSAPPAPPRPAVAPTLIEALVAERARLAGVVARLDATIADLGGAS